MNELQLRTTEMFGEVRTDIYENEKHEMFMTARQLSECLGYSTKGAFDKLISRNPHIKGSEFSCTVALTVHRANGFVKQETRVFNEDGIYEVAFLANTEKALEFHRWVRRLLKLLRKGDLQLTNSKVVFSPEMFEAILNKYLGTIDDRIVALESKKPIQPNFWLWKKHVARKAIDTLTKALHIDERSAYDMVYDNMTSRYGFDKSFAISQFCAKYEIENTVADFATVAVIDVIADVPEYQREFMAVINHIVNNNNEVKIDAPCSKSLDRVQQAIVPLMHKYNDNSPNGSKTYRIVYKKMGKTNKVWKNMQTRYRCKSKKQLLLKYDKYYSEFAQTVNNLLSESEAIPNES